MQRDENLG